MKAQQYAEALFLSSQNKSEEDVERIVLATIELLKEKGYIRLLPAILRELEKIQTRREETKELVVRVAQDSDVDAFKEQIQKDVETLAATSLPKKVISDNTLIGGYELRAKGARIDRTYKRSLLTLYNNLITN